MWQKRQAGLLREEIEAALFQLRSHTDLYRIIREPLIKARRGLAADAANDRPWPLLPLIACEAVCGCCEPALPAAAALQFLLAAGDVFDDVEDADSPGSLPAKYGAAVATNAATTLLVLAEKALTGLRSKGVEDRIAVTVIEEVNSSYLTACAGQHLDLSFAAGAVMTEETYLEITGMKSASQIACACRTGALLGGASTEVLDIIMAFGYNLGMAAQITNDILGINRGEDILRRKITLPAIYALAQAEGEIRGRLEQHYLHPFQSSADPDTIRDLLYQTGAVYYTSVKMETYRQAAREAISAMYESGVETGKLSLFLE